MTTLEATKEETTTKTGEIVFKAGVTRGRHDLLPEFSGLYRCDAGCNTPSAALFLRTAENEHPLGFCGHHYRKHQAALDIDNLYALKVKDGEHSLSTLKGERAGYLNT